MPVRAFTSHLREIELGEGKGSKRVLKGCKVDIKGMVRAWNQS